MLKSGDIINHSHGYRIYLVIDPNAKLRYHTLVSLLVLYANDDDFLKPGQIVSESDRYLDEQIVDGRFSLL
jgi:hypothetical protein